MTIIKDYSWNIICLQYLYIFKPNCTSLAFRTFHALWSMPNIRNISKMLEYKIFQLWNISMPNLQIIRPRITPIFMVGANHRESRTNNIFIFFLFISMNWQLAPSTEFIHLQLHLEDSCLISEYEFPWVFWKGKVATK